MFRQRKYLILALFTLLLLGFVSVRLLGLYDVPWWTPEGGGGGGGCYQSASGYGLCGAIGQADAGGGIGGIYQVHSGFWVGPRLTRFRVMMPLVVK
jgi:hypothetical protein